MATIHIDLEDLKAFLRYMELGLSQYQQVKGGDTALFQTIGVGVMYELALATRVKHDTGRSELRAAVSTLVADLRAQGVTAEAKPAGGRKPSCH